MNEESIKRRLYDLKTYLNRNWKSLGNHFEDRLLAKIEYEKLLVKLKEIQNG